MAPAMGDRHGGEVGPSTQRWARWCSGWASMVSGSWSNLLAHVFTRTEPARRPPVGIAEKAHHRGHERAREPGLRRRSPRRHADADRLMVTTLASAKARKTQAMIAAAPVTRRPLRSRPSATAARLSPVANPRLLHAREQEHLVSPSTVRRRRRRGGRGCGIEAGRPVNPRMFERWPLVEDPHQAPNAALSESAFMSTALKGRTTRAKQDGEDDQRGDQHETRWPAVCARSCS